MRLYILPSKTCCWHIIQPNKINRHILCYCCAGWFLGISICATPCLRSFKWLVIGASVVLRRAAIKQFLHTRIYRPILHTRARKSKRYTIFIISSPSQTCWVCCVFVCADVCQCLVCFNQELLPKTPSSGAQCGIIINRNPTRAPKSTSFRQEFFYLICIYTRIKEEILPVTNNTHENFGSKREWGKSVVVSLSSERAPNIYNAQSFRLLLYILYIV